MLTVTNYNCESCYHAENIDLRPKFSQHQLYIDVQVIVCQLNIDRDIFTLEMRK
uniref:Uncharacterized protein n=1 Tax=Anguilla anguilla TaxID=7936 RepID=A0A0E9WZY3_ANGAN